MQIIWFLSGVSARLLGLMGLAAAGILALNAAEQGTGDLVALATLATLALFCLVKSVQFLLPRMHAQTLERTMNAWPRIAFIFVSLIWLLLSSFVILEFGRQSGIAPPMARVLLGMVIVGLLLFLIFFLLGASYRAAEAQLARQPASDEPQVEYYARPRSPMTADAPPPRKLPKRYETITVNPHSNLRPRDVWDYYGFIILAVGAIGGILAFRFSSTVQTAELNLLIEAHLRTIYILITLMFAAPMVFVAALRAPASRGMAGVSGLKRLFFLLAGMPVLGGVLTVVIAFDLAPHVWHLATTNEPGTVQYEVVEVERYGALGTCLRISPIAALDQNMVICGLDPAIIASSPPGTRLEATGPLSDYAHTMETVTVLP